MPEVGIFLVVGHLAKLFSYIHIHLIRISTIFISLARFPNLSSYQSQLTNKVQIQWVRWMLESHGCEQGIEYPRI
jgi:hypothetical protein